MTDWLVVGAGLSGATVARELAEAGHNVSVLEKNSYVSGNAYDPIVKGARIHLHGPHIFHTNSTRVFDYLSRFTDWYDYEHRVLAKIGRKLVPVPFNFASIDQLFAPKKAQALKEKLALDVGTRQEVSVIKLMESKDKDLKTLGKYVFRKVFLGYSIKQWGMKPEFLSPNVLSRVPIRANYDDRYFTDEFQKMPKDGFEAMVRRILDHENIRVDLSVSADAFWDAITPSTKVIYTGAIDEFFSFELGTLPYRSLRFEVRRKSKSGNVLPTTTLNFPNRKKYTRVTEFRQFLEPKLPGSTLAFEYSESYRQGRNVPYYPIPNEENEKLYSQYLELAKVRYPTVYFLGRLGEYKYWNMDQAVARALAFAASRIAEEA